MDKKVADAIAGYVRDNRQGKITNDDCSNKIILLNHIYGKRIWELKQKRKRQKHQQKKHKGDHQ